MKTIIRYVAASLGIFVLVGCSSEVNSAERQVPHFRQLMTAQQYSQIYDESSDDFKNATPKRDLINLLSAVDRKLGAMKSTTRTTWNVYRSTSGSFVSLVFKTQFENGAGDEMFTYRLGNGMPVLAGYHITSNALVTQ